MCIQENKTFYRVMQQGVHKNVGWVVLCSTTLDCDRMNVERKLTDFQIHFWTFRYDTKQFLAFAAKFEKSTHIFGTKEIFTDFSKHYKVFIDCYVYWFVFAGPKILAIELKRLCDTFYENQMIYRSYEEMQAWTY